jgi:hypothetical protein
MSFVGTELKFVGCRKPFVEYIIADRSAQAMKAGIGQPFQGYSRNSTACACPWRKL